MTRIERTDETHVPGLITLEDPAGRDPATAGAKAAALARARQAGLPVLDGFVLPTETAAAWPAGRPHELPDDLERNLHWAWQELSGGVAAVVVRSSSPGEDGSVSSHAGQFRSILDVRTWDRLLDAVDEVIASAGDGPMAVLVQPFVVPEWGGVLFGADPITGRRDRLVVAAVPGGPDRLVSGTESGTQLVMTRRGRMVEGGPSARRMLGRPVRRSLVGVARRAEALFGAPQDIEWAVRQDGSLVLLQSRPITTIGAEADREGSGPLYGPGPVAETFPEALSPLEADLWVPPLREGLRQALLMLAAAPARRLRTSPLVVTVDGRPAVDLDLIGASPIRRPVLARLDPRPPARRMLAAWRLGRLRAAMPSLAEGVILDVDTELRSLPPLESLSVRELLRVLERSNGVLRSLHGYEVLAGQLLPAGTTGATAASRALEVLAAERADRPDATDEQLIAEQPVLLGLHPPAIGPSPALPPVPRLAGQRTGAVTGAEPTPWRELLRLRVRWVQELTVRTSLTIGAALVERGVLDAAEDVRHLDLDLVRAALGGRPVDRPRRRPKTTTPLPRAFRQSGNGVVVPVAVSGDDRTGRGAGGGRGMGPVHSGDGPPPPGAVLVVPTLDPGLAARLPGLAGLVAETGSVLSHLAILAREHEVPTVVDLPGAVERFPDGTWVVVDGGSGEVSAVESQEWRAA